MWAHVGAQTRWVTWLRRARTPGEAAGGGNRASCVTARGIASDGSQQGRVQYRQGNDTPHTKEKKKTKSRQDKHKHIHQAQTSESVPPCNQPRIGTPYGANNHTTERSVRAHYHHHNHRKTPTSAQQHSIVPAASLLASFSSSSLPSPHYLVPSLPGTHPSALEHAGTARD